MRHSMKGRKFGRDSQHRNAMLTNLTKSLIEYEQIKTTLPKAKDLRQVADKIITKGKKGTLAARRDLISILGSKTLSAKVIDTLAHRFRDRPGGYTRVFKAGYRYGDNAPMAIIELVDRDLSAKNKNKDESITVDDSEALKSSV